MKKIFIILFSIQMLFAIDVQEIKKGDTTEGSVERGEKKYYKVEIKRLKDVHITLTDLTGDVNLYAKTDNNPTEDLLPRIRKNHCYSSNNDNENEECQYQIVTTQSSANGHEPMVYIMVYGVEAGSYTLKVTEEETEYIPTLTTKAGYAIVEKGYTNHYKLHAKAGETVTVKLFNLTADADLRLKVGRKANKHTFDCKSTNGGTKEDICSVTLKKDNIVYVEVDGYKKAGYDIKLVPKIENEDKKLIKLAKEHCLNKNNSTGEVLCSGEKNIAYVLTSELLSNSLYRVNFITKTTKKTHTLQKPTVNNEYNFVPLKNTELVAVNIRYDIGDLMDITDFYYQGEKLQLSFTFSEPVNTQKINGKYKTIENGKKLEITYEEADFQDPNNFWKNYKEIYDISNPAEVKLISKTEVTCLGKEWLKKAIEDGKDVSTSNVSCIKDMSKLFIGNTSFNQDISSWNVSNVTNMDSMFKDATSFNQDISSWNVSNVTNMDYMFNNTSSFSNHNLSYWNVSNVVTKKHFADGVGDGNRAPKWK